MRILVTGATGFIGSRLLSRLAVECDELVVLRRVSSSTGPIKNIKFHDIIGDITNYDDVRRAVEGCDLVFHVAAEVVYWSKLNEHQYNVNVIGTRNIVNACLDAKVKRLIHTSSIVAIGLSSDGYPANEETRFNLTPLKINYCDTKKMAEDEVQKGVQLGLDAVIVNPGAVFGPGDMRRFHGSLYGGKVWSHIFYVGGGIATVDVDDVVEGHIRAWKRGRKGERYILANENLTFKEISAVIGSFLRWPRPVIKIPNWFITLMAYSLAPVSWITRRPPLVTRQMATFTRYDLFFSGDKARQELGMQFRPFRESVERAVEWFKAHGYLS